MRKPLVPVIRIDPAGCKIARMKMKTDMPALRNLLRAGRHDEIGQEPFAEVLGGKVYIFARMGQEPGQPGFRLRGMTENTTGIAVIAVKAPSGGLADIEIDMDWLKRELVWVAACESGKNISKPED